MVTSERRAQLIEGLRSELSWCALVEAEFVTDPDFVSHNSKSNSNWRSCSFFRFLACNPIDRKPLTNFALGPAQVEVEMCSIVFESIKCLCRPLSQSFDANLHSRSVSRTHFTIHNSQLRLDTHAQDAQNRARPGSRSFFRLVCLWFWLSVSLSGSLAQITGAQQNAQPPTVDWPCARSNLHRLGQSPATGCRFSKKRRRSDCGWELAFQFGGE